jgi:uncharacterized repeat protein (TIGR03806 family)
LRVGVFVALAACSGGGEPCKLPMGELGVDPSGTMCNKLSTYGWFDDLASQTPADGVFAYEVRTPLFADYATKDRFLWLPPGAQMTWSDTDSFDMPVGSVMIKTFSYLHDRRDPSAGRELLETRLLIHGDDGWYGAAYVYDGDDATLKVAGSVIDASWIHDDGSERTNTYVVPNKNQCKDCHAEKAEHVISPIGPKARHLNTDGQLEALIARGWLAGAPAPEMWPQTPVATDPSTGSLDARARGWLDINCSFCHNPTGMARTSGLFLDIGQTEPAKFGVCKPPVATGRGSGGRAYDIIPGAPDASIMMYRVESTEPEIKMPELGRNLVYDEGAALIREWITAMPGGC